MLSSVEMFEIWRFERKMLLLLFFKQIRVNKG